MQNKCLNLCIESSNRLNLIKLFKIENIGEPIYCDVNIVLFFDFSDELRTIILWCDDNMIIGSPVTIKMFCPKGLI